MCLYHHSCCIRKLKYQTARTIIKIPDSTTVHPDGEGYTSESFSARLVCQPARNPPSLPMVTDPCRRQDLIIWLWHHPYEFCQKALLGTGSGGVTCRDGGVGCPNESAATVGIMDGFFSLEYWGYEMCHDPSFFTATFCRYISVHIFLRCFEMSKAGHGTFL